jgi:hypothetical protein
MNKLVKTRNIGLNPIKNLTNMNSNNKKFDFFVESKKVVNPQDFTKKINNENTISIFEEKIEINEPLMSVVSFDYTEKGTQYAKITNAKLSSLYNKLCEDQKNLIEQSKNLNRFLLNKEYIEDMETNLIDTCVSIKDTLNNYVSSSVLYNKKDEQLYMNVVAFLNIITRYGYIVSN